MVARRVLAFDGDIRSRTRVAVLVAGVDFILPLRERIQRGETIGPEIVAAGPMLDNAPADWPFRRRLGRQEHSPSDLRPLAEGIWSLLPDRTVTERRREVSSKQE